MSLQEETYTCASLMLLLTCLALVLCSRLILLMQWSLFWLLAST